MRKGIRIGRRLIGLAFIAVAAAGLAGYKHFTGKVTKPGYLFSRVERGDIVLQVAASGTLAAVTTVQVGTQVSGTISEIFADYNAEVKKGQLLARLDPALFQAQVAQQEANVRTAEANLISDAAGIASAKANFEKARVDLLDKQRKLNRTRQLFQENLGTRDDLDTAEAAVNAATASQNAAEAQVESAESGKDADQARLTQARASLESARLNLANTVITSPISGTIISRNVDRGQTVAASFSSPTLFQIGQDLTKMQVNASIDEADVSKVRPGMEAAFTVDAYSGEVFTGKLGQVRLAASTVQNVVTYNAIIDVSNPQLRLKPGMTATVKILIRKVEDVLRLPNSALRFKPSLTDQELEAAYLRGQERQEYTTRRSTPAIDPKQSENPRGTSLPLVLARAGVSPPTRDNVSVGSEGTPLNTGREVNAAMRRTVWVLDAGGLLTPVMVTLGLTDGTYTEIIEGGLGEGEPVITGLAAASEGTAKSSSGLTSAPGFGPGMGGGPPPPPR